MAPPPDTIDAAYDALKAALVDTLTSNAADAVVAGEVRAVRQMGIGLNFSLINSRAVEATRAYRENLVRFGGSEVVEMVNGRPTAVFKPWLQEAIESDREQIAAIIRDGIETGKPLKQVEQALDEVFAMREHSARSTAFRETKVLFNKGTMDRFKSEDLHRGIWRHMMPQPHPREEHQERDGKVYDLDDPVWDELGLWYCHCWCEPVIEGRTVIDNVTTDNTDEGGVWRTIRGTPVFIQDGEDIGQAIHRTFGSSGGPDIGGKSKIDIPKSGSSSPTIRVGKTTWKRRDGDTPPAAAAWIRKESGKSDITFARNAMNYAKTNINYTYQNNSWEVRSPERALAEGEGDCSEIAVLTVAMLKSQGMDAQVVHGHTTKGDPATLHDSVEVMIDGKPVFLESLQFPDWEKVGDGLHPKETIRQ